MEKKYTIFLLPKKVSSNFGGKIESTKEAAPFPNFGDTLQLIYSRGTLLYLEHILHLQLVYMAS